MDDELRALSAAIDARSGGRLDEAVSILETFVSRSTITDSLGEPRVSKEYIRTLLMIPDFIRAKHAVEAHGLEGAWVNVLFARAYRRNNRAYDALLAWRQALLADPAHMEALSGVAQLSSTSALVRGDSWADDILRTNPAYQPRFIVDVGANVGSEALSLADHFATASILAFEPVVTTYNALRQHTRHEPRISCFNIALGRERLTTFISARPLDTTNSITGRDDNNSQRVDVHRGGDFLSERDVDKIDILKVDTEGHDLAVLEGFDTFIRSKSIGFIQVEAGMNRQNVTHVYYEDFVRFLSPSGYELFGIYEQIREFDGRPHLRRANLVFSLTNPWRLQ